MPWELSTLDWCSELSNWVPELSAGGEFWSCAFRELSFIYWFLVLGSWLVAHMFNVCSTGVELCSALLPLAGFLAAALAFLASADALPALALAVLTA